MTDNDIIKALECCSRADEFFYGRQTYKGESLRILIKDALDLINRQKAEIERLQGLCNRLKQYDEERDIRLHARLTANARTEAITEFAEKLKLRVEGIPWCECKPVQNAIDELAKEMKEGVGE